MIAIAKPPKQIAGYDPVATAGDCLYDPDAAERPVQFVRDSLVHVKGARAGEPFELEEWQADIVRTLFGWKRPDGARRYRKAYIEVPRKNGKSTLVAAIAIYMLMCDEEQGAECYCAASDADQASLIYSIAATMVRKNPTLNGACKIRDSVKRIIFRESFLRAIPADAGVAHGYNSHLNVCDELHAWLGESYEEFYDALQTGLGARTQPLHIDITTAGYDTHSICRQQHDYAARVRDGKAEDPTFLPVLYAAGDKDDWRKESTWRRANPNYGISVDTSFLHAEFRKATQLPRYENTFRRLFLNQWTSQKVRWIDIRHWNACPVGDLILPGAEVCCGLDLSTSADLTALCVAEKRGDGYRLEWRFWVPEKRVDHLQRYDRVPYRQWIEDGWVEVIPGSRVIDQSLILEVVLETAERYDVKIVGYDPFVATKLAQELADVHGVRMVKFQPGYGKLSEPSKELEKHIIAGTLDHGDNPVATWHAESVEVKQDFNKNIRPVRPDNNEYGKKIDGIMAAVMAIGSWASVPADAVFEYSGGLQL